MTEVEKLVAELRSNSTLAVCPFDRRSPDYWTAGDDGKPCTMCGATEAIEDCNKCTGADLRIMVRAADALTALSAQLAAVTKEALTNHEMYTTEFLRALAAEAGAGRLREAIRWALGEGNSDFGDKIPEPRAGRPFPLYWWRTELRERAALKEPDAQGHAGMESD